MTFSAASDRTAFFLPCHRQSYFHRRLVNIFSWLLKAVISDSNDTFDLYSILIAAKNFLFGQFLGIRQMPIDVKMGTKRSTSNSVFYSISNCLFHLSFRYEFLGRFFALYRRTSISPSSSTIHSPAISAPNTKNNRFCARTENLFNLCKFGIKLHFPINYLIRSHFCRCLFWELEPRSLSQIDVDGMFLLEDDTSLWFICLIKNADNYREQLSPAPACVKFFIASAGDFEARDSFSQQRINIYLFLPSAKPSSAVRWCRSSFLFWCENKYLINRCFLFADLLLSFSPRSDAAKSLN